MHHLKIVITKQNGRQSVGQGFSPNELKEADVNKQQAKQIGLRVDVKRKSTHQENVDCIKAHAKQAKAKAEAAPKKPKPTFKAKQKS
jgi:large subunit ribosomal protein L13e